MVYCRDTTNHFAAVQRRQVASSSVEEPRQPEEVLPKAVHPYRSTRRNELQGVP